MPRETPEPVNIPEQTGTMDWDTGYMLPDLLWSMEQSILVFETSPLSEATAIQVAYSSVAAIKCAITYIRLFEYCDQGVKIRILDYVGDATEVLDAYEQRSRRTAIVDDVRHQLEVLADTPKVNLEA